MSANLNVYGESAGSILEAVVTGATYTVPATNVAKITKLAGNMAGAGYLYLRFATVHQFGMYFWAAGHQSEDNIMLRAPAATIVDMAVVQAGGPFVTRAWIGGILELTAQP